MEKPIHKVCGFPNTTQKRLLSGIQPTGLLHLGNYLGAMVQWKKMHQEIPSLFSIVDCHAITVKQDPKILAEHTILTAATIIACGIDPNKAIIFLQSSNRNIPQLTWLFSCIARIGWLNRMTQFKDKAGKNKENSSLGLYSYPILMAADILTFFATHVPVGEDQKQHLELARDIAQKFNKDYGNEDFFPLPEPYIQSVSGRVMSLRDGTNKMSKSDMSEASRINILDSNDIIVKKIKSAKSDSELLPDNLEDLKKRPEANNLLSILASLCRKPVSTIINTYAGKGFAALKKDLAESIILEFQPIRERILYLSKDKYELQRILVQGGRKAEEISTPIVEQAMKKMGLLSIE